MEISEELRRQKFKLIEGSPLHILFEQRRDLNGMFGSLNDNLMIDYILDTITKYIREKRLYDGSNVGIVFCDKTLESIFQRKMLFVTEIMSLLLERLEKMGFDENVEAARSHIRGRKAMKLCKLQPKFPGNKQYKVKETLRKFLKIKKIKSKEVFSINELQAIICEHVASMKSAKSFEITNIADIRKDPLEEALQVGTFHRSQLNTLIGQQTIQNSPEIIKKKRVECIRV